MSYALITRPGRKPKEVLLCDRCPDPQPLASVRASLPEARRTELLEEKGLRLLVSTRWSLDMPTTHLCSTCMRKEYRLAPLGPSGRRES